jgi:hypothetical protein
MIKVDGEIPAGWVEVDFRLPVGCRLSADDFVRLEAVEAGPHEGGERRLTRGN